ncbi:MAG: serine hydrolase domain-containing protein [Myxococcales bacterium]|jgi:CubicO group peptidase (beta-lactamase class C family)
MTPALRTLPALALLAACATSPAPAPNAKPTPAAQASPAPLDADQRIETASGASFTAPKGWSLERRDGLVALACPDGELAVGLFETNEKAIDDAIAAGWKRLAPGFSGQVKEAVSPPAGDGWDELRVVQYQFPPQAQRFAQAVARRKSETWHVLLFEGPLSAVSRRGAQVNLVASSYRAAGSERESLAGRAPIAFDEARLKAFEAFIEKARVQTAVPGAAFAIVRDGKIVLEKGLGVRELGKAEPVGPETRFMIGSTTKALTTLMMARLVDDGLFAWETPVIELRPDFALADAEATRKLTMRHTVCGCTGMPRRDLDFLFEYGGLTPEKVLESMRSMAPTTGFGEVFQYSNLMIAASGFIAAAARTDEPLGPVYDRRMKALVFDPIGMSATTFDFAEALRGDHAIPHGRDIGLEYRVLPLSIEEAVLKIRPAGGAWSSARDMARYVITELAKGVGPDGKRVVSEANLLERYKPQAKLGEGATYGLGLIVDDFRDVKVVRHGGNTLGFSSDMVWLPEHGIGFVVLNNAGMSGAFNRAVRGYFLEWLFDQPKKSEEALAFEVERFGKMAAEKTKGIDMKPDADKVGRLVGTYRNESLGTLTVRLDEQGALLDVGEWSSHFGTKESDGVTALVLLDAPYAGLGFLVGSQGARTVIKLSDGQKTFEFEPVAATAK